MKHGHARTIPADVRYGNCHSTKTSSGRIWSKLDKDSRLRNRCYRYEKRNQGPRPLTSASPIDGCIYNNCGANNTNGNVSTVAALSCACVVGTRQHTTAYQITSTPRKASEDPMIHRFKFEPPTQRASNGPHTTIVIQVACLGTFT